MGDDTKLLQAIALTKSFGSVTACDAVDLDVRAAEIHAVLGENGAGKSTLVKMIYGLLQPDAGELRWHDAPVTIAGPAQARALGIAMVSQHFSLFDNLTVAENVALGLDVAARVQGIGARVAEVSRAYGLALEPHREVWRLSVGERQRIEIVRALMQKPQLLILDEPTSVLTPHEAEQLFATLRVLRQQGCALLYISHKLDEVRSLCERATILRAGKVVATCDPRNETAMSLADLMMGRAIAPLRANAAAAGGARRLAVSGLTLAPDDPHGVFLKDVTFDVAGGEIVGIAGVAGNGQSELFAALSGERLAPEAGMIRLDGRACGQLSISQRRRLGAAFVPEERLGHAVASRFLLSDNLLITTHATQPVVRHGLIDRTTVLRELDHLCTAFDVRKPGRDPPAASLSGGNLQKFVIGRDLVHAPGVLVVNQPTWGVDAGATMMIRQALVDLARAGSAVLVISQDLDELLEMTDRIAVLARGRLAAPQATRRSDRAEIGLMMAGIARRPEEGEDAARA